MPTAQVYSGTGGVLTTRVARDPKALLERLAKRQS